MSNGGPLFSVQYSPILHAPPAAAGRENTVMPRAAGVQKATSFGIREWLARQ